MFCPVPLGWDEHTDGSEVCGVSRKLDRQANGGDRAGVRDAVRLGRRGNAFAALCGGGRRSNPYGFTRPPPGRIQETAMCMSDYDAWKTRAPETYDDDDPRLEVCDYCGMPHPCECDRADYEE